MIQLRQDNALGTLYNMVGFQTKLKYAEQVRVFQTIPGLERGPICAAWGVTSQHIYKFTAVTGQSIATKRKAQSPLCGTNYRC